MSRLWLVTILALVLAAPHLATAQMSLVGFKHDCSIYNQC